MSLAIRMALYALFVTLSNQGVDIYDPETDQISFQLQDLTLVLSGIVGFAATFVASRFAKVK
jgi:hypothetical protein